MPGMRSLVGLNDAGGANVPELMTAARSRYSTIALDVRFCTPAFLGNADQQAQWRTPPFKTLIRQWWRVVKAEEMGCERADLVRALVDQENKLFGRATDKGATQSALRLRLNAGGWPKGSQEGWPDDPPAVLHPEVGRNVGPALYLGYGPLGYNRDRRTTAFNEVKGAPGTFRTAIAPSERARLRVAVPHAFEGDVMSALRLAAWFGTVGSRSRNGWGSLTLEHEDISALPDLALVVRYSRPFEDALKSDWPHAFGSDDRGLLVWRAGPQRGWREAMKDLARIKIAVRTQFNFVDGGPHRQLHDRHLLAYPVTKHPFSGFSGGDRLANQLRFKVLQDGTGAFVPWIFHVPAGLPEPLAGKTGLDKGALHARQVAVWRQVHEKLDELLPGSRLSGGPR